MQRESDALQAFIAAASDAACTVEDARSALAALQPHLKRAGRLPTGTVRRDASLAMAAMLRRHSVDEDVVCAAFDCVASAWSSVATVLGVGGVDASGMPIPAQDALIRAALLALTHQRTLRATRAFVEWWMHVGSEVMLHRDAELAPWDEPAVAAIAERLVELVAPPPSPAAEGTGGITTGDTASAASRDDASASSVPPDASASPALQRQQQALLVSVLQYFCTLATTAETRRSLLRGLGDRHRFTPVAAAVAAHCQSGPVADDFYALLTTLPHNADGEGFAPLPSSADDDEAEAGVGREAAGAGSAAEGGAGAGGTAAAARRPASTAAASASQQPLHPPELLATALSVFTAHAHVGGGETRCGCGGLSSFASKLAGIAEWESTAPALLGAGLMQALAAVASATASGAVGTAGGAGAGAGAASASIPQSGSGAIRTGRSLGHHGSAHGDFDHHHRDYDCPQPAVVLEHLGDVVHCALGNDDASAPAKLAKSPPLARATAMAAAAADPSTPAFFTACCDIADASLAPAADRSEQCLVPVLSSLSIMARCPGGTAPLLACGAPARTLHWLRSRRLRADTAQRVRVSVVSLWAALAREPAGAAALLGPCVGAAAVIEALSAATAFDMPSIPIRMKKRGADGCYAERLEDRAGEWNCGPTQQTAAGPAVACMGRLIMAAARARAASSSEASDDGALLVAANVAASANASAAEEQTALPLLQRALRIRLQHAVVSRLLGPGAALAELVQSAAVSPDAHIVLPPLAACGALAYLVALPDAVLGTQAERDVPRRGTDALTTGDAVCHHAAAGIFAAAVLLHAGGEAASAARALLAAPFHVADVMLVAGVATAPDSSASTMSAIRFGGSGGTPAPAAEMLWTERSLLNLLARDAEWALTHGAWVSTTRPRNVHLILGICGAMLALQPKADSVPVVTARGADVSTGMSASGIRGLAAAAGAHRDSHPHSTANAAVGFAVHTAAAACEHESGCAGAGELNALAAALGCCLRNPVFSHSFFHAPVPVTPLDEVLLTLPPAAPPLHEMITALSQRGELALAHAEAAPSPAVTTGAVIARTLARIAAWDVAFPELHDEVAAWIGSFAASQRTTPTQTTWEALAAALSFCTSTERLQRICSSSPTFRELRRDGSSGFTSVAASIMAACNTTAAASSLVGQRASAADSDGGAAAGISGSCASGATDSGESFADSGMPAELIRYTVFATAGIAAAAWRRRRHAVLGYFADPEE